MRHQRLVAPVLRSGESPLATPSDGLPDDVARQIASRLRIVAAPVNVGIGFELVLAFAIGVINQWEPKVLVG